MTDELAAFIKARLDEDQQLMRHTRNWSDRDWTINTVDGRVTIHADEADVIAWIEHEGEPGQRLAEFITRHDPGHIRDDINSKRAIVDRCKAAADTKTDDGGLLRFLAVMTLRDLATVYREHPDYRSEWAPGT